MRRSQIGEFLKVKLPAVLAIASSTGMICDSDWLQQSHTNITTKDMCDRLHPQGGRILCSPPHAEAWLHTYPNSLTEHEDFES
jgi:hypothetical protein